MFTISFLARVLLITRPVRFKEKLCDPNVSLGHRMSGQCGLNIQPPSLFVNTKLTLAS